MCALIRPEAEEIEEDRDDRDEESETIDSGEDMDETEFANDDRRWETYDWGEDVCHLSLIWDAQTLDACAMAKTMEEDLSMQDAALTAGVLNPVWGVSRGVGRRPRAGALRPVE
jgi:hypothetical protein